MSFMERIALEAQNQYPRRWIAHENAIDKDNHGIITLELHKTDISKWGKIWIIHQLIM